MKLAIEKIDRDADVSLLMFICRWVMWYVNVRICEYWLALSSSFWIFFFFLSEQGAEHTAAIEIQAGRRRRGSEDAPVRYRTQDVRYDMRALIVSKRITTAGGV